jgi:hypothetical protein
MANEGRENFEMGQFTNIDYDISEEELLKKEDELIVYYDTIKNGLNKHRSGLLSKYNYDEWVKRYMLSKKELKGEYQKKCNKEHKEKEYNQEYKEKK